MASVSCSSGTNKNRCPVAPDEQRERDRPDGEQRRYKWKSLQINQERLSCVLLVIKAKINDDAYIVLL